MTERTISNPAFAYAKLYIGNGDTVADVTYGKDEGGKPARGCLLWSLRIS